MCETWREVTLVQTPQRSVCELQPVQKRKKELMEFVHERRILADSKTFVVLSM